MTTTLSPEQSEETAPEIVYRSNAEIAECTCPDACERDHELD